jgi:hypothetical protein
MTETEQTYYPPLERVAKALQTGQPWNGGEHRHQWEFIEAWWKDLPLGDAVEHWATLFCPCGAVVDREIEREPLDKPEPGDD